MTAIKKTAIKKYSALNLQRPVGLYFQNFDPWKIIIKINIIFPLNIIKRSFF